MKSQVGLQLIGSQLDLEVCLAYHWLIIGRRLCYAKTQKRYQLFGLRLACLSDPFEFKSPAFIRSQWEPE